MGQSPAFTWKPALIYQHVLHIVGGLQLCVIFQGSVRERCLVCSCLQRVRAAFVVVTFNDKGILRRI